MTSPRTLRSPAAATLGSLASLASLLLTLASGSACAVDAGGATDPAPGPVHGAEPDDLALANRDEPAPPVPMDAGAGWSEAETLHVGAAMFDRAEARSRRAHPMWIAGSPAAPVPLQIDATAADASGTVRIAVLGPLVGGKREVLAAMGYATPVHAAKLTVNVAATGEHLVVIGSYALATETGYTLAAACSAGAAESVCGGASVDVLAAPKVGALVATASGRVIHGELGNVLRDRDFDVELELWASPPMRSWAAVKVATGTASGSQLNVIVPDSVQAGDDLTLVVREAGGRVLDSGVLTRFAPEAKELARTDAILYGDLASLQIAGVAGFFEGRAGIVLRSLTNDREIARDTTTATLPGAASNGFGAFDAAFTPDLALADGTVNPVLPRNGELLEVGTLDGNAELSALACFEYCNDASGEATCTGGARPCPAP